jgi:hypothetical protein
MIVSEAVARYVNQDSAQVEGWFFPPDMLSCCLIDQIQRAQGPKGNLCEVGVWHGKSLVLFSHFLAADERLFGFDLFPDDLLAKARGNMERFGVLAQTQLIAQDTSKLTLEQLKPVLGEGVRLLHIDAGHEYHEVLHQLHLFAPFVKRAGCIVMDDYQDREFPGIGAAVLDFAEIDRPRRFVPFFAGGNKMFLCEAGEAPRYQAAMLQTEEIRGQSRVTRVRDFTILVGFSKLPSSAEHCLQQIGALGFPATYQADEQGLAGRASRFDQLKWGYSDR